VASKPDADDAGQSRARISGTCCREDIRDVDVSRMPRSRTFHDDCSSDDDIHLRQVSATAAVDLSDTSHESGKPANRMRRRQEMSNGHHQVREGASDESLWTRLDANVNVLQTLARVRARVRFRRTTGTSPVDNASRDTGRYKRQRSTNSSLERLFKFKQKHEGRGYDCQLMYLFIF
jgi:hypothetical protein